MIKEHKYVVLHLTAHRNVDYRDAKSMMVTLETVDAMERDNVV